MPTNKKLDSYFQELEQQEQFSGVVLVTQGERRLYSGAFGYASRAWKIRNSLDTRFNTASITKLFTAVALLQLIEQGRLDFTTSAIDYLALEDTAISPEVNVFHLLTHTSGIADDADEEAGESYEALWQERPNYSVTEAADFLPQFAYKPPNFAPGQGCRYCNCGYVLLGLMIEKASGMSYRDYVREHIFARAGMERSGFFRMDRVHEDVAEGSDPIYDENDQIVGWKKNIYAFPPIGTPDGGACVTAGELTRFLTAVREGVLLSEEMTEAFLTPQVHYRDQEGWSQKYGYGVWFRMDPANRVEFYQKEGIATGVSGILRHYPEPELTVVLLSNMEEGVWSPVRQIHEMVVAGSFRE